MRSKLRLVLCSRAFQNCDRFLPFLEARELRAPQMAQTNTTYADNLGRSHMAETLGLGWKTWRVTSRNPRDAHKDLDGETVPYSALFSNGARWPGDPSLDVGQRANCQCVVEYSRTRP